MRIFIYLLFATLSIPSIAAPAGLQDSVQNVLNNSLYLELAEEEALKIYPGLPDNFPDFGIPTDFAVMGGTSAHGSQQVRLDTELGREQALAALSNSIVASGFIDYYELAGRPLNEFIVTELTRSTRIFCSDELAYLSLLFIEENDVNSVVMTNTAGASLPQFVSCQDEAKQPPGFSVYGNELRAMMQDGPVLDLPSDAVVIHAPVIGNTSRASDTYKTSAMFVGDLGLSQLQQLFAKQARGQAWLEENQSINDANASTNWVRKINERDSLYAEITLEQRAEARFLLRMLVSRTPPTN